VSVDWLAGGVACALVAEPCHCIVIVSAQDIEVFEREVDLASARKAQPRLFKLRAKRWHQCAIGLQSGKSLVQARQTRGTRSAGKGGGQGAANVLPEQGF